jgi:hypothetical protein
MSEDNKIEEALEEVLSAFPLLDFREPLPPKKKTLEDIKREFPVLNYDYGSAVYFSRKYPMLPDEVYTIMAENFQKNNI